MIRRLLRQAGAVVAALVVAAAAGLGTAWHLYQRPGPSAQPVTLVVAKGSGLRAIAEQLAAAGVIDHPLLFAAAAKLERQPLKAGEYLFPAGISARAAVALLQSGATVVRRLTVPEGYTALQIMELMHRTAGLSGDVATPPPEGSLLPETYHFSFGDSRQELLQRMQQAMRDTLDALWEQRAPNLPLGSKADAVVLASIVERETAVPEERPRVAAVFLNRLRRGMKLQSDPTVIYGLSRGAGVLDRPLSKADLASVHPYNTYVIDGLPPAPIANPGQASLAAVLKPAATDDLYFVADGNGGHAFAKTLAEHNRNVARLRRIEREREAAESAAPRRP